MNWQREQRLRPRISTSAPRQMGQQAAFAWLEVDSGAAMVMKSGGMALPFIHE
jgi:hypothetical protein